MRGPAAINRQRCTVLRGLERRHLGEADNVVLRPNSSNVVSTIVAMATGSDMPTSETRTGTPN